MNYWIASYPRSGNTFLRILFKEVYGINTWEGYGKESPQKVLEHIKRKPQNKFALIKTHELPTKVSIYDADFKTIYLVRDGRDAAVSMAYHRSNIVSAGSDYAYNLLTCILAPFGTSFGGWSKHVKDWSSKADIVIKFEDLIRDPITQLKRLEEIMQLPKGNYTKIPTFKDLKTKKFSLGSGNNKLTEEQQKKRREKFFRSGKTNAWQNKISSDLQQIFTHKHGEQLKQLGYNVEDTVKPFIYLKYVKSYALWFQGMIKEKMGKKKPE